MISIFSQSPALRSCLPCSHSERQRRISIHAVYESFVIKYQSAGKSRCMQIRKQSASGCGLSPTCTFRTAPSRGRSQRYVLASPCSHSERQRRISVHAVYESFVIKYQSAGKSRCMQIRKQSASGCGLSPTCTFRTINKNNIPMIGTPERWD